MIQILMLNSQMKNLKSVEEIQRAIEYLFSNSPLLNFTKFDLKNDPKVLIVKTLSQADFIVIPAMTPAISLFLQKIKIKEISNAKIIILSLGHGSRHGFYYYFWEIDKFISSRDLFVASCEAEKSLLQKSFSNINVVNLPYPILHTSNFHVHNPKKPFVLIYSGRINRQKNIHSIIQALYILIKKGFNLSLEIYGTFDENTISTLGIAEYDYLNFLKELIANFSLEEKVHIYPFLKEELIIEKNKSFNLIYISPSLNLDENFGVGPLLFLSNNVPCILSNWGGFREHKKYFKNLTTLVNAHRSTLGGPFIKPIDLSRKISKIISNKSSFKSPSLTKKYSDSTNNKWLQLVIKNSNCTSNTLQISPQNDLKKMLDIQASKNFINRMSQHSAETFNNKIYQDWNDKILVSALKTYGMRRKKTNCKKNKNLFIPNYLPKELNNFIDAHKGYIVPKEFREPISRKTIKAGVHFEE